MRVRSAIHSSFMALFSILIILLLFHPPLTTAFITTAYRNMPSSSCRRPHLVLFYMVHIFDKQSNRNARHTHKCWRRLGGGGSDKRIGHLIAFFPSRDLQYRFTATLRMRPSNRFACSYQSDRPSLLSFGVPAPTGVVRRVLPPIGRRRAVWCWECLARGFPAGTP